MKRTVLMKGDCKGLLKKIPDGGIDLVVTSPPYDNLRSYNGQPPFTFDDFKTVAAGLARVLKDGGVIVWVVGDATVKGSETGTGFRQALYFKELGLNLHDTMIYRKSGFSFPDTNRYHQCFEYMFVFSKGRPKTFNPIRDRTNRCFGQRIGGTRRLFDGSLVAKRGFSENGRIGRFGNRTNVWDIPNGYFKSTTDRAAYRHPAIFPEALARDHILSWSDEGDTVLDPFMGSGTTGKMCKLAKRKFIGIEVDKEYFSLARERINKAS